MEPLVWARILFNSASQPQIYKILLRGRDVVMRNFGLKTQADTPTEVLENGFMFPVLSTAPNEVILGVDDTHLDFRVGICVQNSMMSLTTTVHFNNNLD